LLGGLMTLIGTPPNLLVSTALEEAGYSGFAFFDFAWIGVPVLLVGTAFMVLVGRHCLPVTNLMSERQEQRGLLLRYSLEERVFTLRLPDHALLAGKSIAETGLVSSAGL